MSLSFGYKNVIGMLLIGIGLFFFIISPDMVDLIYGRGLYQGLRKLFHLISWIPIPMIYLILAGLIYILIRWVRSKNTLVKKLMDLGFGLAVIFILFYWMWAFNYRRNSFDTRYQVGISPLDSISLNLEFENAKAAIIATRPAQLQTSTPEENESKIRAKIKAVCATYGYYSPGIIRVKALYPKGILLRLKTAGVYMPYTGEAYVDAGLHPLQMVYTQAHEMCHGYGVTDEGACNFLAYLATISLKDSSIVYSGHLSYYRYVAGTYRHYYPERYKILRAALPESIKNDLDAINTTMLQYPDILPKLRDQIYDTYLKAQGIEDGLGSYDKVIDYVRHARKSGMIL